LTTSSIAERRNSAGHRRHGKRGTAPSRTVETLRAESHATLTQLVTMLGYPPHWADELERRAFAAGRVWSPTALHDAADAG